VANHCFGTDDPDQLSPILGSSSYKVLKRNDDGWLHGKRLRETGKEDFNENVSRLWMKDQGRFWPFRQHFKHKQKECQGGWVIRL